MPVQSLRGRMRVAQNRKTLSWVERGGGGGWGWGGRGGGGGGKRVDCVRFVGQGFFQV